MNTQDLKNLVADIQQLTNVINAYETFRLCYLDKPEDRLYHASDKTWWRRDDTEYLGQLISTDAPEEVMKLAKQNVDLHAYIGYLEKKIARLKGKK